MTLAAGDKAPDFTMATDDGGTVSLAGLAGKPFVLYFYPKDDTPGCTTEACGFRDNLPEFGKLGVAVVGVSRDSAARHAKFKAKYALPFTLGADDDGTVTEAYGVWVEKSMYGRKSMGIERSTFLVDSAGKIARVWRKVKVAGHVEDVLAAAKGL